MERYDQRFGRGLAPRIRAAFEGAIAQLESLLRSIDNVAPDFTTDEGRLRWATAMFARSVYFEAQALLSLFDADEGRTIPAHVRAQYECAVKIAYLERNRGKLQDFFDLEPFERWYLASTRTTLDQQLRSTIEADCQEVIRRNPDLLKGDKNATAILAGKLPPNYRAIYNRLKLPGVGCMIDQLNKTDPAWNRDLHTVIFGVGSLPTHSSILYLRDAFEERQGGTVFSIDRHYDGAPDYLLQSANYVIGFCGKVAERFGLLEEDRKAALEEVFKRHQQLARDLGVNGRGTTS